MQQVLDDNGGTDWVYSKVATKVKNTNINAAKQMLVGQVAATQDATTAQQIDSLVGEEVPEAETHALHERVAELKLKRECSTPPKPATVRRRLALLNMGAEPGPSGLRNRQIALLRKVQNGTQALLKLSLIHISEPTRPY